MFRVILFFGSAPIKLLNNSFAENHIKSGENSTKNSVQLIYSIATHNSNTKMLFHRILLIILILCASSIVKVVKCDDFPSLLMANASIAILLDREYLHTQYDTVLMDVKVIVERVLREDLKNGGLIVTYYSWTSINFKRDFTAVLSVASCKDTWKIFQEAREESLLFLALTDPDCPRLPSTEAIMV